MEMIRLLLIEYMQYIADEQELSYEEVYDRCIGRDSEAYFDIKMIDRAVYNGCKILKESEDCILCDWIGEGEVKFIALRRSEINRIGFSNPERIDIYLDALAENNDGLIDLVSLDENDLL